MRTVVIDPGHGGKDPGARGVTGSDEKDITLTIAQMVAERLSEDPQIRVVLTRTDDTYVSLEQRTAIANAGARISSCRSRQRERETRSSRGGNHAQQHRRPRDDPRRRSRTISR